MHKLLLAGVTMGALTAFSGAAHAGIERTFSGAGSAGFLGPTFGFEQWYYGLSPRNSSDIGWSSPGGGNGETVSDESVPVADFEITFASGVIDLTQLATPAQDCAGDTNGGTVFCTSADIPWTASLNSPDSITFTAPSAAADLAPLADYFVDIFLYSGGSGSAFSGAWSTAAPEPPSLALLGVGLAGLGLIRRRKPV